MAASRVPQVRVRFLHANLGSFNADTHPQAKILSEPFSPPPMGKAVPPSYMLKEDSELGISCLTS